MFWRSFPTWWLSDSRWTPLLLGKIADLPERILKYEFESRNNLSHCDFKVDESLVGLVEVLANDFWKVILWIHPSHRVDFFRKPVALVPVPLHFVSQSSKMNWNFV
jgi:hypothetical protein